MDAIISSTLSQFKLYFIFIAILLILTTILKSRWFKGKFGERLINKLLTKNLDSNEYHLIKDVTLCTRDGTHDDTYDGAHHQTNSGTTQIDHLLVTKYGLFVIETKNMKGWIFGSANQKTWTQKIYRYTGKFQNPLRQNYKHTQTLIEQLNLNKEHVFSVIVFVGDCEFKTQMPENVTYPRGMLEYIQSKTQVVMSEQEVILLRDTIEAIKKKPGMKTNRAHVKHLKDKHRAGRG